MTASKVGAWEGAHATRPSQIGLGPFIRPPRLALMAIVMGGLLHLLGSGRIPIATAPRLIIAVTSLTAGFSIMARAALRFRHLGTTHKCGGRPTVFVTDGLYAYTRNPMYLGLLLQVLGSAIAWGSLVSLAAPAMFVVYLDSVVIPLEEAHLHDVFGAEYADYTKRAARWIGIPRNVLGT